MKSIIKQFAVLIVIVLMAMTAVAAGRQKPESQSDLQKEAKITLQKAREAALAKVPGGKVESEELEREHGKLIYSFDIKTAQPGVTEIAVDAINGKIISMTRETPAQEKAEKEKEGKSNRKAAPRKE